MNRRSNDDAQLPTRDDPATLRQEDAQSSATIPLIIGHRGASAHAPENTLVAFRRALDDGADGLEFDVRLARDRVPVVIHDANLRRTALRDGLVALHTSAELGETDVGTWFNRRYPEHAREEYARERVPTLAQVFETVAERARVLYVELKCDAGEDYEALAAEVVRIVLAYSLKSRVVVESFQLNAVRAVKRFAPEIRTAALFERRLARPAPTARAMIKEARDCAADEIALHHSLARPRTIEAMRRVGFEVLVWTVDDSCWSRRGRETGLRALITNQPARMRAALDALSD
ncbi:MAG TPA: glycerophosphodiester phosphodiesterase family protein [Pyrinomonadaceae bacterium]|jgi:glycerophosphoryl diester phosphodiesterase